MDKNVLMIVQKNLGSSPQCIDTLVNMKYAIKLMQNSGSLSPTIEIPPYRVNGCAIKATREADII
jgi:hypothetical protein